VAIYSRAITSTEVTTHYNNAKDYMMGICSDVSPELLSNPVLTATLNQAYTYNVNASGNPAPKYYLDKKPTNMTIDENTGVISWTPTSFSQNAPVSVRITNSGGTIYQNYSIFLSNPPVCNNNLEAFWNFETTGSPQVDQIAAYTLNSNSASSLPARVGGRVGYGLLFDGVNDSLDMEDSFEASSQNVFFDFDDVPNFSIELWMKSAATAGNVMVLLGRDETDNNTQYWLGVNSSGNLALYFRDYIGNALYYDSESNLLDNQWHHIVVTYNATSNNMEIYVDKALIETLNQNFGNFGGFNDLNIGCLFDHSGADRFWYKGIIDELAFYNTNISETLVAADYDKGILSKGICSQNYAPLIVSTATITATEDAAYSYKLIATDGSENDISDITAVVKPAWLTLVYNASDTTATLSGTPTNDNVGANNVTLRVTDGSINVDQTFTITVANVNDAPTITSTPAASVNEDALYSYVVVGSDVDAGDVLTYTAPTKPAWLTFDAGTRTLSGTPTNDNVGVADITITVSDGTASVNQSYSLTVNNVNDAPEFTSDPVLTVHANQLYMYTVTASDVDEGDVITYTVQSKPSWLSFVAGSTSAILSGTPTVNDQGTHAIILRVSDGHVETMQGYTLTVTAPSALEDIDNSIVNQVFPNPASDKVYFRFAKAGNIRIEIYDMSGNLRKQIQGENGDAIEVNISDLSHGLFIYKAYQDDKVGIGKITKE
jgi:VCBS repeat-containing protein